MSFYFQLVILNCFSLTKVQTENGDRPQPWLPQHKTGSARSEGFYRTSTKDKRTYMNNTELSAELPSTQVFKWCRWECLSIYFNTFSADCLQILSRERASPGNSQHRCVGDPTSGWNSVACCLRSIVIVTCSSSTN